MSLQREVINGTGQGVAATVCSNQKPTGIGGLLPLLGKCHLKEAKSFSDNTDLSV